MALDKLIGSFTGRKQKNQGLLAVHFQKGGVAFAYVKQPKQLGQVDLCEFVACETDQRFKVIKQFVKKHKLGANTNVNLVLTPSDYKTLTVDAPEVEPSEYQQAAKWLVKDLLDYPVTEAAIDLFAMPTGSQSKLYLVCARQSLIRQYMREFQKSRLCLMGIETIELALRNHLLIKQEGHCLLMFKTDFFTGIMIFKEQTIHLIRSIRADLEELSHKKLLTELQRSLDYYKKQAQQGMPQKIILTSNLLEYENLQDNLTAHTGMPVEGLQPAEFLTMPEVGENTYRYTITALGASQTWAIKQSLSTE